MAGHVPVYKGVVYHIASRFFLCVPAIILGRHYGLVYGLSTLAAFWIALSICEDGSMLFNPKRFEDDATFYFVMALFGNALYQATIFVH